ncbi:hypothetical protein N7486_003840 [Penicillium sp. IBT 16267x]|nr:hypothetical protein N7486_003840 [Penicillium sp. IBT 16267x]
MAPFGPEISWFSMTVGTRCVSTYIAVGHARIEVPIKNKNCFILLDKAQTDDSGGEKTVSGAGDKTGSAAVCDDAFGTSDMIPVQEKESNYPNKSSKKAGMAIGRELRSIACFKKMESV